MIPLTLQELARHHFFQRKDMMWMGYNVTFNGCQHGLLENLTLDFGCYRFECNLCISGNFFSSDNSEKGTDFTSPVDNIFTSATCLPNTDLLDSISISFPWYNI
jgi:hypothetical protein